MFEVPHVDSMIAVEVATVAGTGTIVVIIIGPVTMTVSATRPIAAMITALVVSIATLLLDVMIATAAVEIVEIAEMIVVTMVEGTVVVPVILLLMASPRLQGKVGSHTEVEDMTTVISTIGTPVDDCGQLIYSGTERPAK